VKFKYTHNIENVDSSRSGPSLKIIEYFSYNIETFSLLEVIKYTIKRKNVFVRARGFYVDFVMAVSKKKKKKKKKKWKRRVKKEKERKREKVVVLLLVITV